MRCKDVFGRIMREAIHPTSSHHGKESIDCKEEWNGDDQADWGATPVESRFSSHHGWASLMLNGKVKSLLMMMMITPTSSSGFALGKCETNGW
jgi:hypothetical protein